MLCLAHAWTGALANWLAVWRAGYLLSGGIEWLKYVGAGACQSSVYPHSACGCLIIQPHTYILAGL